MTSALERRHPLDWLFDWRPMTDGAHGSRPVLLRTDPHFGVGKMIDGEWWIEFPRRVLKVRPTGWTPLDPLAFVRR